MSQPLIFTLANGKFASAFIQVDETGAPVRNTDILARLDSLESIVPHAVEDYDALPDATDHADEFFFVRHDTSSKQAGIYASNGTWHRVVKFTNWS